MLKEFFRSLFSKKNKSEKLVPPAFNVAESAPHKADFEVSELSYEEYVRVMGQDRRQATTYVSHDRRKNSSNKTS